MCVPLLALVIQPLSGGSASADPMQVEGGAPQTMAILTGPYFGGHLVPGRPRGIIFFDCRQSALLVTRCPPPPVTPLWIRNTGPDESRFRCSCTSRSERPRRSLLSLPSPKRASLQLLICSAGSGAPRLSLVASYSSRVSCLHCNAPPLPHCALSSAHVLLAEGLRRAQSAVYAVWPSRSRLSPCPGSAISAGCAAGHSGQRWSGF